MKQSFVDEESCIKISNRAALLALMDECRKSGNRVLKNLDLSEIDDCNSLDFTGYTLENIMFSKFTMERSEKKLLYNVSFLGATLKNVGFPQARLVQCNFDKFNRNSIRAQQEETGYPTTDIAGIDDKETELCNVNFFFCDLEYCRFRGTIMKLADFRYSHITDCTMSECNITLGDFYFCGFHGATNFVGSIFDSCSFTCATFENACIRMKSFPNGIVQENVEAYHEQIIHGKNWYKYNPCGYHSSMNHAAEEDDSLESRINLAKEAADFYTELSGMYAGKGLNRDSNEAYRKAKLNELKFYKLSLEQDNLSRKERRRLRRNRNKTLLIKWMGYGYKWQNTFGAIAATIIIAFIIGWVFSAEISIGNIEKVFRASLISSLSLDKDFFDEIPFFVAFFESAVSILLVGFLGFIVANNVRNNN